MMDEKWTPFSDIKEKKREELCLCIENFMKTSNPSVA